MSIVRFTSQKTTPVCRHRSRLYLEPLEDRCVPSILLVTRSNDDVAQLGTLRYAVAHASSGDFILVLNSVLGHPPIVLTHGELLLNQDVTITGLLNVPETISGDGTSRVFEVAQGAHVTLRDVVVTGGNGLADNPLGNVDREGEGGGILNFGTLTIRDSTFSKNSVSISGGGIANVHGVVTISHSSVSGNTANASGGGILDDDGMMTINDSTVSGNSANQGGGIFGVGDFRMIRCTVSGNHAVLRRGGGDGAGMQVGSGAMIIDSIISGNTADPNVGHGGGIDTAGGLTVIGCTISDNIGFLGGGIHGSGTWTISGSTLSGNEGFYGGGIYVNGSTATVSNCDFMNNIASHLGGGIYNNGANLTLTANLFCDNKPDAVFGGYIDGGGNQFC